VKTVLIPVRSLIHPEVQTLTGLIFLFSFVAIKSIFPAIFE